MNIIEIIAIILLSVMYILYAWSLKFTYKHRRRMEPKWVIALVCFPFAPILIPYTYVVILIDYWRK